MTRKVTRDLALEMSCATMSPKQGGNPKRSPLTQADAEATTTAVYYQKEREIQALRNFELMRIENK